MLVTRSLHQCVTSFI